MRLERVPEPRCRSPTHCPLPEELKEDVIVNQSWDLDHMAYTKWTPRRCARHVLCSLQAEVKLARFQQLKHRKSPGAMEPQIPFHRPAYFSVEHNLWAEDKFGWIDGSLLRLYQTSPRLREAAEKVILSQALLREPNSELQDDQIGPEPVDEAGQPAYFSIEHNRWIEQYHGWWEGSLLHAYQESQSLSNEARKLIKWAVRCTLLERREMSAGLIETDETNQDLFAEDPRDSPPSYTDDIAPPIYLECYSKVMPGRLGDRYAPGAREHDILYHAIPENWSLPFIEPSPHGRYDLLSRQRLQRRRYA